MPAVDRPEVVGRYAIYGKIASGGMASVHFGRLLGTAGFSRTVAIKRLHPHLAEDPEFLTTMLDEARLAARIHHPNVVPTLDVVADEGELLVVMEYVRGESLSRLLRAESAVGRRAPLPIVSAIVVGALHGLHAAHEATSEDGTPLGIVHRDVSPQNILVGADGQSRVIDFGVAKAAGRLQTTSKGIIKGKLSYMAPEQLASATVTRQSDLYAMAVVLWEALTGRRLFQGEDQTALLGRVLAGAKDPPSRHVPDLPAGLDALVMQGLARQPEDRFASALEMADALMRAVPPAFPPDVATWVMDVAGEPLAQRGALLAGIESGSHVPFVVSASGIVRTSSLAALTPDPQTSSVSLELPAHGPRLRSARMAGVVIAALCLAALSAGVGVLWTRGRAAATATTGGATATSGPIPTSSDAPRDTGNQAPASSAQPPNTLPGGPSSAALPPPPDLASATPRSRPPAFHPPPRSKPATSHDPLAP
jgi:eukaryotic-like serine/threonine-protein kinase